MNIFLTLLIVLFIAIAIWQLIKIFDLTKSDDNGVATDKDNKLNGYLMLGFLAFIYIYTIYSVYKWGRFPLLSDSASEHGTDIDTLMVISLVLIFIVQTITQLLLHYFAFKYRGEKGRKALFYADNNTLEIVWTGVPVIVLAGLIIYGLTTWIKITNPDYEDPMVIELYAQQFNWKARYSGEDKMLGKASVRLIDIDRANILGVDERDPNAQDDVITTELHLPVNKPVIFKMRSQDVLHSAYMPHFRAQMNCVPGMVTQFGLTPTITTAEMRDKKNIKEMVGNINTIRGENKAKILESGQELNYQFDYLLICNKICGTSHYNMQMKIVVETEEEFNKWMKEQTLFKNSIKTN